LINIDYIDFIYYIVFLCITEYLAKGVPKSVPKNIAKNCHFMVVKHGVHYSNIYVILVIFFIEEDSV
jgi:hypothetical protein